MCVIEKYYEVIKKILGLLDTVEEGLYHIQNQIIQLQYEDAFVLLQDAVEAIGSVQNALIPMRKEFDENNLDVLAFAVTQSISNAVGSYEQGKEVNLESQIKKEIMLAFKNWKAEIERILAPYIVS